jgi:D-amino-acid oxidase
MPPRVTVVGAGVIGLTCAVRLAESGLAVDVLARDLPLETTSAAGSGLWFPAPRGAAATPLGERELGWAALTLAELRAADGPAAGVRIVRGHLLGGPAAVPPAWAEQVADDVRLVTESAPAPGRPSGFSVELPVADPRRYLPWLQARLTAAGGTLTRLALPALPARGVVVDATGAAARALAGDPRTEPVRTQVVLVANPGLETWWWDLASPLAVVPHGDVVAVEGAGEPGEWNPAPDEASARALLERAAELVPALRGATLRGVRVALRPVRTGAPGPRVELERRPTDEDAGRVLVHCYGHGDLGLALSWGCADEVARLVGPLATSLAEPAELP